MKKSLCTFCSTGFFILIATKPSKFQSVYWQNDLGKKLSVAIQTGVSADIIFGKRIRLLINPNYYWGTSVVASYNVTYADATNPSFAPIKAKIEGYGSYFNWNFGVKYLIY